MVDVDENIGLIGKIFGKPQFDKNDEALANKFIIENSQGLKFENYYDGDELLRRQDYFTATKKQFYKGEDFNQNVPGALIDMSGMFLGAGGSGLIANVGTKGLSKLILKQEVKTSVKAGLAGATIDASWQVGTQIYDQSINNNGYVDFRDIDLNYPRIVFSTVAGAATVPSMINSAKEVKHSIGAISKQWRDFLNTKSINREDKLLNNMIGNGENIFRHIIFQGANHELRNIIKDNTVGGSNE
jgi:hypothetical protein